jgi:hypothetical protein
LFTGVNDTGEKFISGVVVTSDHFSAVSKTPITDDNFIAGINDTDDQRKSVTMINPRCQQHRR